MEGIARAAETLHQRAGKTRTVRLYRRFRPGAEAGKPNGVRLKPPKSYTPP